MRMVCWEGHAGGVGGVETPSTPSTLSGAGGEVWAGGRSDIAGGCGSCSVSINGCGGGSGGCRVNLHADLAVLSGRVLRFLVVLGVLIVRREGLVLFEASPVGVGARARLTVALKSVPNAVIL